MSVFLQRIGLLSSGGGGGIGDPLWSEVSLLLGLNGADGATSTSDEGPLSRGISFNGSAQLDDAQIKFGSTSLLNPSGSGGINTLNHASISVANTTDFTIEGWWRFVSIGQTHGLTDMRDSSGEGEHSFYIQADNKLVFVTWNSFNAQAVLISTGTVAADTWYHLAATRVGSTCRIFIDGNLEDTDTETLTPTSNASNFRMGHYLSPNYKLDGWMDEFRWTKGTARYTANFTKPDAAFPRSA